MLCRTLSLIRLDNLRIAAQPLLCKCWECDYCIDMLRRKVTAKAARGRPTTFLTLTVNPKHEADPDSAAHRLKVSLTVLVRRLRRIFPNASIQYMAVFERHESGWPHLHVLLRAPFVPQRWISAFMKERANAPIVDIRAVRSPRDVARYVGKYLAKEPRRFQGCQRYWTSRDWRTEADREADRARKQEGWQLATASIDQIAEYISRKGFLIEWEATPGRANGFVAWRPPPADPGAPEGEA